MIDLRRPCAVCGRQINLSELLYWYGAGPMKPWEAEAWFCSPEHATYYIKEVKGHV